MADIERLVNGQLFKSSKSNLSPADLLDKPEARIEDLLLGYSRIQVRIARPDFKAVPWIKGVDPADDVSKTLKNHLVENVQKRVDLKIVNIRKELLLREG